MGYHVAVQCVGDVRTRMDAVYSERDSVGGDKSHPQGHAQAGGQPLYTNVSELYPHNCTARQLAASDGETILLKPSPLESDVGCVCVHFVSVQDGDKPHILLQKSLLVSHRETTTVARQI